MAKRQYNKWSMQNMNAAIQDFNNGKLRFNEVCRTYGIPKPTFRRHLKGLNSQKKIGRPSDLTEQMETELVHHILDLESRFFGLTITDLRHLAFQLAEKYKLPHRFNKVQELAGWKWYYKFMKNHPEIALRMPEPTSMARCKGFNKNIVSEFFDKYEKILDDFQFGPNEIFNMDETGLNTVHKPAKILALKGKHQVGAVTSGERGINTTCVCCMNASGDFIPPMLIFKRKRMTDILKRGGPPKTLYTCSESGWIVASIFVEWLQHFINHLKLEKQLNHKILLILDGHTTHTKNLEAINLAREYGIVMFSLPAHTTHKLQPLDRSFFKSLKTNFNKECAVWMRNHPGETIKQSNISEILGVAYPRSVCMDIAMKGFETCGLWPCNRHRIPDEEYVVLDENEMTQTDMQLSDPGPSTANVSTNAHDQTDASIRTVIENLSPIYRLPPQTSKKTSKAVVLTASPYKNMLENKLDGPTKPKKRSLIEKTSNTWYCILCRKDEEKSMIQCIKCNIWVHDNCAGVGKATYSYTCQHCIRSTI